MNSSQFYCLVGQFSSYALPLSAVTGSVPMLHTIERLGTFRARIDVHCNELTQIAGARHGPGLTASGMYIKILHLAGQVG